MKEEIVKEQAQKFQALAVRRTEISDVPKT